MSDDWRLRIDLHEDGLARALTARLEGSELEHDIEREFHRRVVVSVDGSEVFCYADTREQVEQAERLVRSVAAEEGWDVDAELARWHPVAEEWQAPDAPLPRTESEQEAEREELVAEEREESAEQGYPDYEVRVQFRSHHDATAFADRLREEGVQSVRRWHYVLIGAPDEESANALAERVRGEAPAGSQVTVEGNLRAVMDTRPPNPFAFLGGLGG